MPSHSASTQVDLDSFIPDEDTKGKQEHDEGFRQVETQERVNSPTPSDGARSTEQDEAPARTSSFTSIADHVEAIRSVAERLAAVDSSSSSTSSTPSQSHSSSAASSSYTTESAGSEGNISPTSSHLAHRAFNDSRLSSRSSLGVDGREVTSWWPAIRTTYDPARKLKPDEVWTQRAIFSCIVFCVNAACLAAALTTPNHQWVFAFIVFVKSKDCIQSIYSGIALAVRSLYRLIFPPKPVEGKWILTLIPAYSESEEQIVKTVFSLRDNGVEPHKQVMCVILDGRHRDIREHMTIVIKSFRCAYTTSKQKKGELSVDVGFMEDVPVIVIEKLQNAGKKDSLILCHDLFNWPRDNMPHYSQLLRAQIWEEILPSLTMTEGFNKFDMIFCTDADSTIFKGAVASLANAVARDKNAIAACGVLFVELEPGNEWSIWTLYQMFQYSFGQFVRRSAEGLWGKVTCLPGCITMIAVRPECANAIRMYAAPILTYPVIFHQVQYLGTDRRLTFQLLNQGRYLRTLFVPAAVSETAAPQSLTHYLSQRRRWGSNAYYNDWFYVFGVRQALITRAMCFVDVVRLTMVYYRIANTILFLYGLAKRFEVMKLIPLIVVSQIPTIWFTFSTIFLYRELRTRSVRLLLGYFINKVMSPAISVTVFTTVVKNLGSQVWGLTGITQTSPGVAAATPGDAKRLSRTKSLGDRLEEDKVAEHLGGDTGVTEERTGSIGSSIIYRLRRLWHVSFADVSGAGLADEEGQRRESGRARRASRRLTQEEEMMRVEGEERLMGCFDMEGMDDFA